MRKINQFAQTRRDIILIFLFQYQTQNKYPPCIREISIAAEIPSTSVVNYCLDQLEKTGYVERNRRMSRGTILSPAGAYQARLMLGLKPETHCEHCGAPLGKDGKYLKPEPSTKIRARNRQSVYPTAA